MAHITLILVLVASRVIFFLLSFSLRSSSSCTSRPSATLPKLLAASLPLPWQAPPHHFSSFVPKCRPSLLLPSAYQQPSTCEVPGSPELLWGRLFLQRLHYLHRRLLPFLHPFACPALISGSRPLSCPESSSSPDEGSCVHPPEAQVPAGGDARLWPNQSTAPDVFSGFGQASFSSWGWRRERRRRQRGRERRGQQSEQQPPSLSSGPGFSAGCRGDKTDSRKPPFPQHKIGWRSEGLKLH